MSFFGKLVDFVGSGVGGKIVDAVAFHFPPDMSEKEKMKLAVAEAARQYELELLKVAQQEQEVFNSRIKDLEGNASDLNKAGWPGRVILFLRGSQRAIWGFALLIMDFMVFSGQWQLTGTTAQNAANSLDLQSAFRVINILVLGFLFGERAMCNVMPFFRSRFQRGGTQRPDSTQNSALG